MAYRRTERVARRLAARRDAILAAAAALASEGGMAAVQIVPVAERAGIAAGTVYRYFPSKTDLVAALMSDFAQDELDALRAAAAAAPGPLSALAAAVAAVASHALSRRRLVWAVVAEPVEPEVEAVRLDFRTELTAEIETRLRAAVSAQGLPEQDTAIVAPAIVGALLEGLVGPLAPRNLSDAAKAREAVQSLTLMVLRAIGVLDARARGLVVQTVLPAAGGGAQRVTKAS